VKKIKGNDGKVSSVRSMNGNGTLFSSPPFMTPWHTTTVLALRTASILLAFISTKKRAYASTYLNRTVSSIALTFWRNKAKPQRVMVYQSVTG
jgi:hypothetical protein